MPHPFKQYEIKALKVLLKDEFIEQELLALLDKVSAAHVEYTNYGFYASIQHASIGETRRVFSGPSTLSGRFGDKRAGFVAFLENDKLTLETFPLDGEALPATFRDSAVQVVHLASHEKV